MTTDAVESYGRELASLSLRGSVLIGLRSALRARDVAEPDGFWSEPAERVSRLRVAAKWVVLGWDAPDTAADFDAAAIDAYLACTRSDASRSKSRSADYLASLSAKIADQAGASDDRRAQQESRKAEDAARAHALRASRAAQRSALAAVLSGAGDTERAVRYSLGAIVYASQAATAVRPWPSAKRPTARDAFDAATTRDLDTIRTQEAASSTRRPSMLTLGPLWAPDTLPPRRYEHHDEPHGCALEIELPDGIRLDDGVAWSRLLLAHANVLSQVQGGGGFQPRTVELTSRHDAQDVSTGRVLRIVLECLHDDPPEQTRVLLAEILHAQTLVRAARGVSDTRAWIRGHVGFGSDTDVDAQILDELRSESSVSAEWQHAIRQSPTPEPLAQRALRDTIADAPRRAPPGRYGVFLRGRVGSLSELLLAGDFLTGRRTVV